MWLVSAFAGASAARADELTITTHLALAEAGFTNGPFGEAIPFELTARAIAVRTWHERARFFVYDVAGGGIAGCAGNQHPGFAFGGGVVAAQGDVGLRLAPSSAWSPYVAGGARLDATFVAVPAEQTMNNSLDGLAGTNGVAALRLGAGASLVRDRTVLLVGPIVQLAERATGSLSGARGFGELGARAQLERAQLLHVAVELTYGWSPTQHDVALGQTDQTMNFAGALETLVAIPHTRVWLGVRASIARKLDRIGYDDRMLAFDTATPWNPAIALVGGGALP